MGKTPYHRVIPSETIKASRGISTEARRPRARYEHAELFLAKMLLPAIGLQRFCLDPATASPCGLLARQSLASQTSTPLRCAQDDTGGGLLPPRGTTPFAQATRLRVNCRAGACSRRVAQRRSRKQCGYSQQIADKDCRGRQSLRFA